MKGLSVVLMLASLIAVAPTLASAQSGENADTRKVIRHVTPKYPEIARLMQLSGTVRLEAFVMANGAVKDVKVKGGNPVFIQPAQDAVREWKWQKGDRDSTELIEINFRPQ